MAIATTFRYALGTTILVFNSTVAVGDPPTTGILYGQTGTDSMRYECVQSSDYMNCEFVQVSVRHEFDAAKMAEALAKARENYSSMTKAEIDKECKDSNKMSELAQALRGGTAPKDMDARQARELQKMTAVEKAETLKIVESLIETCKSPSVDGFVNMLRQSLDMQSRTCSVSANPFKQQFKKVDGSDTWVVVQEGPYGPCGVINISRFEPDPTSDSKFEFWKYFSKKVVTNKTAKGVLMSCSALDEGEYEYDWPSRTVQKGCDYITFGLL